MSTGASKSPSAMASVLRRKLRQRDERKGLQLARSVEKATIVFVVCDRGDRYLSTGVFPA